VHFLEGYIEIVKTLNRTTLNSYYIYLFVFCIELLVIHTKNLTVTLSFICEMSPYRRQQYIGNKFSKRL